MEKLKFYFSDETTLTVPENIQVKYMINSAINSTGHNISISILHRLTDIDFILKDIYTINIKDKIVIKVERYNNLLLLDSIEGENLTTSWNLGSDIVAGEEIYNEVINIGVG